MIRHRRLWFDFFLIRREYSIHLLILSQHCMCYYCPLFLVQHRHYKRWLTNYSFKGKLDFKDKVQSSAVCLPAYSKQYSCACWFLVNWTSGHPTGLESPWRSRRIYSTPFSPVVPNKLQTENKDSNKRWKQKPNLPKELVIYPLEGWIAQALLWIRALD